MRKPRAPRPPREKKPKAPRAKPVSRAALAAASKAKIEGAKRRAATVKGEALAKKRGVKAKADEAWEILSKIARVGFDEANRVRCAIYIIEHGEAGATGDWTDDNATEEQILAAIQTRSFTGDNPGASDG